MSEKEFKNVLIDLGRRDVTDEQVKEMLNEADENKDGVLQWDEFIEVRIIISSDVICIDVQKAEDYQQRSLHNSAQD
jgi:hypothetical protein